MTTTLTGRLRDSERAAAKVRTLIEHQFATLSREQPRLFHLALKEAEAIAWQSGIHDLVFPDLALEKARAAAAWHERQKAIRDNDATVSVAA
jgi:hypothetical protein